VDPELAREARACLPVNAVGARRARRSTGSRSFRVRPAQIEPLPAEGPGRVVWGRESVATVSFERASKIYPDGTRAVSDLDLAIPDGQLMVLVGPSGCGKTTALRMLAGLETISEGVIRIGERVVNHVPSRDRDIAMVFQSYALYPHLSVYENIAFGLRVKKVPKAEIDKRVKNAARILDLEPFLKRKPRALSGGQRQRVAMGRAIVRQPAAFLMDEPLSNLDAKLRVHMRAEISRLQSELETTTIYVTHDQVEAMTMGDQVAVMRKGELQQVDEPQTLYDRPLNLFVAGFIGSPAMNLLEGTLQRQNGASVVELGSQRIELDSETLASHPALEGYVGRDVIVGIRPEDLEDAALVADAPANRRLHGRVVLREALGSEIVAHVAVDAKAALTEDVRELAEDTDAVTVGDLEDKATAGTEVIGRFNARSRAHQGDEVEVAVDTRALHFFDPETGLGIYDSKGGAPA
jgi:multiple sugar transport system ATP-binding protein